MTETSIQERIIAKTIQHPLVGHAEIAIEENGCRQVSCFDTQRVLIFVTTVFPDGRQETRTVDPPKRR